MTSDDRSLQSQAANAENQATTTAGNLGATAAGIGSNIIPGLERATTVQPGIAPTDLANMENIAQQTSGGVAGGLKGDLATRAARLRNPAGVNAASAAVAQGASRAEGGALQDTLQKNAELKSQQRQQAYGDLSGLYGTDTSGMLKALSLQAPDVEAGAQAEREGWYQNALQGIQTIGSLGLGSAKAAGFG